MVFCNGTGFVCSFTKRFLPFLGVEASEVSVFTFSSSLESRTVIFLVSGISFCTGTDFVFCFTKRCLPTLGFGASGVAGITSSSSLESGAVNL